MTEELLNKGFKIIGNNTVKDTAPIVVVGAARGGTSMVAGVLAKLGVFMGEKSHAPVYEDVKLATAMESNNFEEAEKIIASYNQKYPRWGYKRPSSINQLEFVDKFFQTPRYLFVYKDIFSIANRNAVSMLIENVVGNMQQALTQYQKTLDFISAKQPDAMLFSYDKATVYKSDFINTLIEFCQLEVTDSAINEAIGFIDTESSDYLDKSRITKAAGRIDAVRDNVVFGWGRYLYQKKSAVLDIFINDVWIGETIAQHPRPDLIEKFGQPCAFSFALPENCKLKSDDKIRVRVRNEVEDVNNSPYLIP